MRTNVRNKRLAFFVATVTATLGVILLFATDPSPLRTVQALLIFHF